MPLFGKDLVFYDLLETQAKAAHNAALIFHKLTRNFDKLPEYRQEIEKIERDADELEHQLANRLDSTFVTPLDKEDLHALSSSLDDITDRIDSAVSRLSLYRITLPRPDLDPLVYLLVRITEQMYEAIVTLRKMQNMEAMKPIFQRIHDLESESDKAFRQALDDLFNAPNPDPMMVMKWKEVYDRIERAVDKCEDVANVVESVIIKYA